MELIIDRLSKQYRGGVRALEDFSLTLEPGVLGLLGPNGAGKSTLMRIVATIARPSAGRVTWNGIDALRNPDAVRRSLGYLPQDFGVYPNLTALEFLRYLAAVRGLGVEAHVREQDGRVVVETSSSSDAARCEIERLAGVERVFAGEPGAQ